MDITHTPLRTVEFSGIYECECTDLYIPMTIRYLSACLKEHIRDIRNGNRNQRLSKYS